MQDVENFHDLFSSLREAGCADVGDQALDLLVEDFAAPGLLGRLRRLKLSSDSSESTQGWSLRIVCKEMRDNSELAARVFDTEAAFYSGGLAGQAGIRVPKLYHVRPEREGVQGALFLEEVVGHQCVRQINGLSIEQTFGAINAIGRLHLLGYGSHSSAVSWAPAPSVSPITMFGTHVLRGYKGDWPRFIAPYAEHLADNLSPLSEQVCGSNPTLVHGDFHSENILFSESNPGAPVFLDFQCVQSASPMYDVARLLATSVVTGERRQTERAVFDAHYAAISKVTGDRWTYDDAVREFRACLLWNLLTPLALHIIAMNETGATWPAALPILERCVLTIDDWGALR